MVLIEAEVHAYDKYMRAVLTDAVHWMGNGGVLVVLLTPTLPRRPGRSWPAPTCRALGTVAAPLYAASPMCGHTYAATSRTSPGGKSPPRRRDLGHHPAITWSGGGLSSTEPPATTPDTAAVEVTDLLAVITG